MISKHLVHAEACAKQSETAPRTASKCMPDALRSGVDGVSAMPVGDVQLRATRY